MMGNKTLKNFAKSVTSGNNKIVLGVLGIAVIVVYLVVGPLNLLSISGSYSSAYEGAKASFAGIEYNGEKFTVNENVANRPFVSLKGTSFSYKADGPSFMYAGLPKIVGEMTPVFIPQATKAGDIPAQFDVGGIKFTNPFTGSFNAYNNPYTTYSWSITQGNQKVLYQMEEWKTKFYVSISANPDGGAVPFASSQWDEANGRYSDLTVWIKLDTTPTWYFQGQQQAYFAIAQVQLAGITYGGHDQNGVVQASHNQQRIIVNPSSPSSIASLYTRNFGAGANEAADPEQIYSYKGATLNPQYFGNAVYFPITLNSFGSQSWGTPYWDWKAQGDVVSFDFTITQFVVGQWTVQNTQEIPDGYGRQASYDRTGIGIGFDDWLAGWTSNPFYWLLIAGVVLIIFMVVVGKYLPAVFKVANAGIARAGRRVNRRSKKSK